MSTPPSYIRAGTIGLSRRIVHALSLARDDDAAVEGVLREVAQELASPLATLWLLDEPTGLLHWAGDWAAGPRTDELRRADRRLTFAPGVGLPGIVLETLEPAWVADIASARNFPRAEVALRAGVRSVLAGALVSPGGVTGVIEFFGPDARTPTDEQLEDVTIAGRQLAAHLGHTRVEDRLRISEESSASIVHAALDCIITMDDHGRVLDFNPAAEETFGYERDAAVGELLADLIIPAAFREAHHRALGAYVRDGIATILGRRLELEGMRADGSTFPVELTVTRLGTRDPPVFAGFIRDITARRELEAEQARARADAERGRERLAFLAQAGREMAEGSLDWEAALRTVVRSAVPAIADAATLTLAGVDRQLRIVAVAHHDPERERLAWEEVRHHPLDPAANTGPARVIATGRPEVVDRHSITVPLASPAGVTGALSLVVGDSGRRFAPGDLDLVTSLANRAALHIQNARLYAEQAHIAATLQGSLRPRPLPDIPGADVAAGFLAAGELNEVGGDFYDVFPSGDDMWTAIVGDVSGKGPEAAAITALARHTLRTASMLHDDPAANLRLLDRALHAESAASDFCTVFYARICPGDGGIDLRFANGGHPSPMLLRVDGSVESVESGRGPLVGGVEDPSFTEATLHLVSGELLLIYTDGVTEVRTDDPELGVRELRRTLATHAGASAHEVVAAVGRRALELQEGDQRDDIALVAIRALP